VNPIPYTELPQDTFNPLANDSGVNALGEPYGDWLEVIDTTSPAQGFASSSGNQSVEVTGLIPFNKLRSAHRWFMGFAYVDQNTGFLIREMPVQHPIHPQLRCSDFTWKPYIPSPQIIIIAGQGGNPPTQKLSLVNISYFADTSGSGKELFFGNYKYAIVTAKFSGFRYQFLGDTQVRGSSVTNPSTGGRIPIPNGWGGNESNRYMYFDLAPRLETLSADNNSFLGFDETNPVTNLPVIGTKFPVPNAILMAKSDYILKWFNVPLNYISGTTTGASIPELYPSNFLNCIGAVNKYPFLGFDPETLLFKAPSFEIKPWWVPAIDGTTMFFCDVTVPLDYFDPENGNPDSTHSGWNLMPYRVDGLWYHASRFTPRIFPPAAALNGNPYLPLIDFSTIFNNANYLVLY
jgi:hypothetical protein